MLGVRFGVVGVLAREDVKVLTNLVKTLMNLNTTQNAKIKGANLQATNQLNLNTKNLEVSSVQNKHKDAWC
jgi:hypothetical protein